VIDRKETDDVLALVRAIAPSGRLGIELDTLAPRVLIAPKRIEQLTRRHTDYFVEVGSSRKIALNRFGKFNGSLERIVANVEQSYKRSARHKMIIRVLLFLAVTLSGLSAWLAVN
jgi:hypothetical protein